MATGTKSLDFQKQVTAWTKKGSGRMLVVFRESTLRVANEARVPVAKGGNMPILTGNLRRSMQASTKAMPPTVGGKNTFPGFGPDDLNDAPVALVIATAKLGDTIYLGFQAAYAQYVEPRYGFIRLTAQRWPEFVREAGQKLQDRYEGSTGGR